MVTCSGTVVGLVVVGLVVVVVGWSQTQSNSRVLSSRTRPLLAPTPTMRTSMRPVAFGAGSRTLRLAPGGTLEATRFTGTAPPPEGAMPAEKFTGSPTFSPTPNCRMNPRWGSQTNSV